LDLELCGKVEGDKAVKAFDGGRICQVKIDKATAEWWPKLTSGPKPTNVKIDWDTWKDEDEAETEMYSGKSPFQNPQDNDFNFEGMNADQFGGDMPEDEEEGEAMNPEVVEEPEVEPKIEVMEEINTPAAEGEGDGEMADA